MSTGRQANLIVVVTTHSLYWVPRCLTRHHRLCCPIAWQGRSNTSQTSSTTECSIVGKHSVLCAVKPTIPRRWLRRCIQLTIVEPLRLITHDVGWNVTPGSRRLHHLRARRSHRRARCIPVRNLRRLAYVCCCCCY